jgi:hypothetical protein
VGSRRWTPEWESAYSNFVRDQVKQDLLTKHHLLASCTLWPVYVRAVFARIHNLPFLYVAGQKQLSQADKGFRGPLLKWTENGWEQFLDEDERFRGFLNALIGRVLSSNIPKNLYPVAVFENGDQKRASHYVRPGALITASGHTKLVARVDPSRWFPLRAKSATMPTREQYISGLSAMFSNAPDNWLAAWRWPVYCGREGWRLQKGEEMPGYALEEQKSFAKSPAALEYKEKHGWIPLLGGYLEDLIRTPSITKPPRDTFAYEMHALTEYMRVRLEIVKLGTEMASRLSPAQKAPGSQFDEDYSTPNYDQMVDKSYQYLEWMLGHWGKDIGVSGTEFRKAANAEVLEDGSIKTTLYFVIRAKRAGKLSSGPEDAVEARWGIPFLRSLVRELPATAEHAEAEARAIEAGLPRLQARIDKDRATVAAAQAVKKATAPPSGAAWISYQWSRVFGPAATPEQKELSALTSGELDARERQAQASLDAGGKSIAEAKEKAATAKESAQVAREELAALKALGY